MSPTPPTTKCYAQSGEVTDSFRIVDPGKFRVPAWAGVMEEPSAVAPGASHMPAPSLTGTRTFVRDDPYPEQHLQQP